MSYWIEEEGEEALDYGEIYYITCPYCEQDVETKDVCSMPWNLDDEIEFTCPNCKKHFLVRSKYKFEGFFYVKDGEYEDEEILEK